MREITRRLFLLICRDFVVLLLVISPYTLSVVAQDQPIEPGTVIVDSSGTEMVYVPAATFVVGIERERLIKVCEARGEIDAEHCVQVIEEDTGATFTYTIEIPAFWIDRYEVTIDQFSQVCTSDYVWFPGGCIDRQVPPELIQVPNQPQVGISYMDATTFCGARNARLPTEAEWEYAASGPDKFIFPWGNEFNPDYVNPSGDSYPPQRTYPVGSILENQSWIGAYDMAGNAAEWVEDRFLPRFLMILTVNEVHTSHRGFDADIRRVIRGGSWDGRPWPMTTFYRESQPIQTLSEWVGFRCVRSVLPER